ncbi:MAG: hypothetical protein GTN76_01540 [Candidatus Aenigmarchaeota archaeon]|nr:hypothetical protein [Candidatus Aenigmarchaeota archaeon]
MKKNLPTSPPEWSTRDIYLATVLLQCGIPLLRVESRFGKGIFVYQDSEELKRVTSAYLRGELRLDPQGLFEKWKSLKSMAFSQSREDWEQ